MIDRATTGALKSVQGVLEYVSGDDFNDATSYSNR